MLCVLICLFHVLLVDEFKHFFSKHGKVVEHQIIRDHETNRSRGFGFIVFEEEEVVDEILSKGNMIDMSGTQVSSYKWTASEQSVNRIVFRMDFAPSYSPFLIIMDDYQHFHITQMYLLSIMPLATSFCY